MWTAELAPQRHGQPRHGSAPGCWHPEALPATARLWKREFLGACLMGHYSCPTQKKREDEENARGCTQHLLTEPWGHEGAGCAPAKAPVAAGTEGGGRRTEPPLGPRAGRALPTGRGVHMTKTAALTQWGVARCPQAGESVGSGVSDGAFPLSLPSAGRVLLARGGPVLVMTWRKPWGPRPSPSTSPSEPSFLLLPRSPCCT